MTTSLRVLLIVCALILFLGSIHLISHNRLQIKYSLFWLLLSLAVLLVAIFPEIAFAFSNFFGFQTPSNFTLSAGIAFLTLISMMLCIIVSWQARVIRSLVQSVALLKHDIEELSEYSDRDKK
ncbi:DUF2304 domain-containing protein [Olegusella massiliensis]|uniref:DUF2304 domain-containing protein n=1 Tax=Olegusella massiliensis TaxID=1776381 RepID=UPI0040556105